MDDLDPTKFKSTYEIMKQIAQIWDKLSKTKQADLLETVAGKQRGNQVAALIQSFQSGQVEKAYNTALTSSGSALKEQEKYSKGIEFSINRVKASIQALSSDTIKSTWVKGIVDIANALVNVTDKVGLFNIALTGGFLALAKFSDSGITKTLLSISNGIKGVFVNKEADTVTSATNATATQLAVDTKTAEVVANNASTASINANTIAQNANNIAKGESVASETISTTEKMANTASQEANTASVMANEAAVIASTTATEGATVATTMLSTAWKLMPIIAVVGGIFAITKAVDALVVTESEHQQRLESANSAYEESKTKLGDVNSELLTTAKRMDELNSKKNLSFVEQSELDKLKEANQDLLIQKDLLEKTKAQKAKNLADEAVSSYNAKYGQKDLFSDKDELSARVDRYKKSQKFQSTVDSFGNGKVSEGYKAGLDVSKKMLTDDLSKLEEFKKALTEVPFDQLDKNGQKALKNINSSIEMIYKAIDPNKWKQINFSSVFDDKKFKDTKEDLIAIAQAGQLSANTISSNEKYNKLLKDTGLTANEVSSEINSMVSANGDLTNSSNNVSDSLSSQADSMYTLATESKNATGYVNDLGQDVDVSKLQTGISNARSAVADYTSILDELDKNKGKLSEETLDKIVQKYPQLLSCLNDEKALRQQLNDGIKDNKKTSEDYYREVLLLDTNYYNTLVKNHSGLINELSRYYGIDFANFKSTAQAKDTVDNKLVNSCAQRWRNLLNAQALVSEMQSNAYQSAVSNPLMDARNGQFENKLVKQQQDNVKKLAKQSKKEQDMLNKAKNLFKVDNIKADFSKISSGQKSATGSGKSGSGNSSKSSKSKFSQEIDWRQRYIDSIKSSIEELNTLLENTSSPDKQAKIYDKLTNAQTRLQKAYSDTAKSYKNQYEKTLGKLGKNKSAYQKLIESGSSFKVTDFKSESVYNAVSKAKDLYDSYKENKSSAKEASYEANKYAKSLAEIPWEKATKKAESLNNTISTLNTELDNTDNFDKRNKKLEEILSKQKQIIKNYQDAVKNSQKTEDSLYKQLTKQLKKSEEKDTKGGKLSKGEKVQTKGLSGNDLSLAKKYNASVDAVSTNKKSLKTQKVDSNNEISDTKTKQYENTISKYEAQIDTLENKKKDIENAIATAESKGGTAKAKQYQDQIAYNNQEIAKYSELISIVQTQMKSADKNGQKWNDLNGKLQGYQDTMNGLVQSSQDLKQNINQLEFDSFDKGMGKVDSFQEDLDFLNGLIDDNNAILKDSSGNFLGISQDGLSKLALLETGYASAYEESKKYSEEIKSLEELYKNHGITEQNYLSRLSDLKSGLHSAVTQTNDYKSAITELMTTIKNGEIEALDNKLDKFKELIEAQREALDREEALHNYEESISDTTSAMEKIQKRIVDLKRAANSGDREAQKELKEQQDALADKEKELDKTKYDRQHDLQDQALGDAETAYENSIEQQKKDLEEYYKNQQKLMIDVANLTKDKFSEVYDTLLQKAKDNNLDIGTDLQEQLSKVIAGMKIDFDKLSGLSYTDTSSSGNASGSGSATPTTGGDSNPLGKNVSLTILRDILKNGRGSTKSSSKLNKYIMDTLGYNPIDYQQMVDVAEFLGVSGINSVSDVKDNEKNKDRILASLKKKGKFEKGGTINTATDPLVKRLTGEDNFVAVSNGEGFLSKQDTSTVRNLLDFAKDLQPAKMIDAFKPLRTMNPSNLVQNTNSNPVTLQVENMLKIDHVSKDYDVVQAVKDNSRQITNIIAKTLNNA
jgi:hypothetical protein